MITLQTNTRVMYLIRIVDHNGVRYLSDAGYTRNRDQATPFRYGEAVRHKVGQSARGRLVQIVTR